MEKQQKLLKEIICVLRVIYLWKANICTADMGHII